MPIGNGYRVDRELSPVGARDSRMGRMLWQDLGGGARERPMLEAINFTEFLLVQRDKKTQQQRLSTLSSSRVDYVV